MLHSLIAWNAAGEVVGFIDHVVAKDDNGNVIGLIDFEAHEAAGGRLRDVFDVENAVGSGTWPEWIGGRAYDFKVELDPNPGQARARIAALVHKTSAHRRERASIEAAIAERMNEAKVAAKKKGDEQRALLKKRGISDDVIVQFTDPPIKVDLRDILGGPNRPLLLDDAGKTMARPKVTRPNLPVVGR